MERIIFPLKSFIAYVEYLPENTQLNVILKFGKKYAYNVAANEFNAIKRARRKGSFTAANICLKKTGFFMGMVADQEIKQTIHLTKLYGKYLAQ